MKDIFLAACISGNMQDILLGDFQKGSHVRITYYYRSFLQILVLIEMLKDVSWVIFMALFISASMCTWIVYKVQRKYNRGISVDQRFECMELVRCAGAIVVALLVLFFVVNLRTHGRWLTGNTPKDLLTYCMPAINQLQWLSNKEVMISPWWKRLTFC